MVRMLFLTLVGDSMQTKECGKCDRRLPISDFNKDKQKKDGLCCYCRECVSTRAAKKYIQDRQNILSRNKKWQMDNRDKKNAIAREYRLKNHDSALAYQAEWRKKNRGKANAYAAKWRERVGNERILESARHYREANREKTRESALKWQKKNTGKVNALNAARYAAKLRSTPGWANPQEVAEFYIDAARISMETGVLYEVDHIVPLRSKIVCGLHCEANLRVILAFDNRSKGNRRWPDMP